ncbi:MAG: hypothetical protein K6G91_13435 [Kiritimatiellae bacterium]|nr:hypothetical protein [Kiritimatiellia bacterium]
MDQKTVAFARRWARLYVRRKHPYGLDEEDVENRILEFLYYNKDKEEALSEALNAVQNESRRNLRALRPWQVRNAEPHLETQAYRNLACDMRRMCVRQNVRENDRRNVRFVLGMLSPDDRRLADEFMALGSWRRVAAGRRMAWSTFRHGMLAGFKARFKEAWRKVS